MSTLKSVAKFRFSDFYKKKGAFLVHRLQFVLTVKANKRKARISGGTATVILRPLKVTEDQRQTLLYLHVAMKRAWLEAWLHQVAFIIFTYVNRL